MRAARVLARDPGTWEKVCVLGFLLLLVALVPLAHSSVPDQLWIHGIYDAGDADDAVLLGTSMENLVPENQVVIHPPVLAPCVTPAAGRALPVAPLLRIPARAPPKA